MKSVSVLTFLSIVMLLSCGQQQESARALLSLEFASTSLGFRNSGALSAGRLLLWDQQEGTLVSLQSGIELGSLPPTTPVTLEAKSVQGVAVSSSLKLSDDAKFEIASKVRDNAMFKVEDATRINSVKIYDGLSAAYRKLGSNGVNAYGAWRVADATREPERYKYVLLVDEILASEETFSYQSSSSTSASFSVQDAALGSVMVEIPSDTTATCVGHNVVCYFNASVMRAFINESGNLDYAPSAYDSSALSAALRRR